MVTTLRNLNPISLLTITASSLLLTSQPSQALNVNLSTGVNSSNFTNNQGLVTTVSGGNLIDDNTGNAGFDNFFGSDDFLLLGANSIDSNITTDSRDNGNSVARSSLFSLNQTDFNNGILVNFKWAFDGNSTGGFADQDNFNIGLFKDDLTTMAPVLTRNAPIGYASGSESVLLSAANFNVNPPSSGDYFLEIVLNENSDNSSHSSAAGFNNISVSSSSVPFEFSPAQGLLAIGSFWGISAFIKRRKTASIDIDLA